jgi:hypothetical protein
MWGCARRSLWGTSPCAHPSARGSLLHLRAFGMGRTAACPRRPWKGAVDRPWHVGAQTERARRSCARARLWGPYPMRAIPLQSASLTLRWSISRQRAGSGGPCCAISRPPGLFVKQTARGCRPRSGKTRKRTTETGRGERCEQSGAEREPGRRSTPAARAAPRSRARPRAAPPTPCAGLTLTHRRSPKRRPPPRPPRQRRRR